MAFNKQSKGDNKTDVTDEKKKLVVVNFIEMMEKNQKLNRVNPIFPCNGRPFNPVTGTKYTGTNFISTLSRGFEDPRFYTFNNVRDEAKRLGKEIFVKKGEVGIPIFKALQFTFVDNNNKTDDEEGKLKTYAISKYVGTVFNASQIEGLEPWVQRENKVVDFREMELLSLAMQERTKVVVEHSDEGRCYYSPSKHSVHMSHKTRFRSTESYYDTLAHELAHSTGPALGRDMSGGFGSVSYSREELTAEMASVFICQELGMKHDPLSHENHAAYMESWLKGAKEDPEFLFKSARSAEDCCDYMTGHLLEFKKTHGLIEQAEEQKPQESKIILPPAREITRPALVAC